MNTLLIKQTTAWILWFAIFFASLFFLPNLMTFVDIFEQPSSDSSWYFVLTDFRVSIAALIGFALSMGLYLFLRPSDKTGARNLLAFSIIWYGYALGKGVLILLNTRNILYPASATTTWATATAYAESISSYSMIIFLLIALAAVYLLFNWRAERRKASAAVSR
jgi:hypothetical protein